MRTPAQRLLIVSSLLLTASRCAPPAAECDSAIDEGPPELTNSTTARFALRGDPDTCALSCNLDDLGFEPCVAAQTFKVGVGSHTITVRAGGDPTPATYTWTVDTTKPDTTATCPAAVVPDVSIPFASADQSATFVCKLDDEAEAACTPPFVRAAATSAPHTFAVYSIDRAGNKDETPATCNFTVDTTGPIVTIDRAPSGEACPSSTEEQRILFSVAATEPANSVTFECGLDEGTAIDCSSGQNAGAFAWERLGDGEHTLLIVAYDDFENPGPATEVDFVVAGDATPPTVALTGTSPQVNTCVDGAGDVVAGAGGAVAFTAVDPPNGACPVGTHALCTLTHAVGDASEVVAGYDGVDCSESAFLFGDAAGLPQLADGRYTLTVQATDAVGNSGAPLTRTFVVDAAPPVVDFVAPGVPTADPGDPANVVPATTLGGTFTTDADAATASPTFTCTIDGVPQVCDSGGYDLGALPETAAGHTVVIQGTDCVGNVSERTLRFFVDASPPVVTAAPSCDGGAPVGCVLDHTAHTADVTLTLTDAITNIEALDCLLDHDANGNNPLVVADAADLQLVPCADFGLTGLPTSTLSDEVPQRAPRTYSGTVSFTELAPGRHRLWYRANDAWGHAGALAEVAFTMDYTDEPASRFGHVILIGHDYDTVTDATGSLLGNAVALSEARGFDRPIRILALDLGSADADGTPTTNVADAIAVRLDALDGPCTGGCAELATWAGNALAADEDVGARLLGHDVLIVYDQNGPDDAARIGLKDGWADALREFLDAGGVVIVLDGAYAAEGGGPELSRTVDILGDGDVDSLMQSSAATIIGGDLLAECSTTNVLADDVAGGDPAGYTTTGASVVFAVDPLAEQVFTGASGSGLGRLPVVMDWKYPTPTESGPVRVVALDDGERRAADSFALFSDADGALVGLCPLHQDGTASHVVPRGGFVTIVSVAKSCVCDDLGAITTTESCAACTATCGPCDATRTLQTVAGVKPGDELIIGSPDAPPLPPGTATIEVPPFAGAARYAISTGCEATRQQVVTTAALAFDEACMTGAPGRVTLVATAHADDGTVLAYNALLDLDVDVDPGTGDRTLVAGTTAWGAWTADPFSIAVSLSGGSAADTEELVVSLGRAPDEVRFDEVLALNGSTPFWAPIPADVYDGDSTGPFAPVFTTTGRLSFPDDVAGRVLRSRLDVHEAAPTADGARVLDRDAFLPSFTVDTVATDAARPEIAWAQDAATAPIADADGAFVRWRPAFIQNGCSVVDGDAVTSIGGTWTASFPPADTGALVMPELTASGEATLACWLPTTPGKTQVVAFVASSDAAIDQDAVRQAPYVGEALVRGAFAGEIGTTTRAVTSTAP